MTNEELKKLLNEDSPEELSGKLDAKSMLNKCKAENIERQKRISQISIVLSCLIIVLIGSFSIALGLQKNVEKNNDVNPIEEITNNVTGNYNMGKMEINVHNENLGGVGDDMIDNPDSQLIEWYGIQINIICDYTKHTKYKEWEKEFYNGEFQSDPYDTRPLSYHFSNFLNRKVYEYELMDVMFSNQQTHSFWPGTQTISVDYMAKKSNLETMEEALNNMEEYLKCFYEMDDYRNLLKLTNEDYVIKISINEYWPKLNGDE